MAAFNTSINAVFCVLGYDCSICDFLCSICVTYSNKSRYAVSDIAADVKTYKKLKNCIKYLSKLKN